MNKDEIELGIRTGTAGGVPFEQFQLFYESAERVTDRRLALNRANASLASLIVAGLAFAAGWSFMYPKVLAISLTFIAMAAALAAMFCRWWWLQIEAYKDLNSAKFQVLGEMAQSVVYVGNTTERRYAFDPFKWEWLLLEANRSLAKHKAGLALGSSLSELTIPKAFLFFFAAIGAVAIGLIAGIVSGA